MSFSEHIFSIPGNWIAAGVFLIFASFLRRLAKDQWAGWQKATSLTMRSFEHSDPAIVVVQRGCMGFIGAGVYNFIALICLMVALDQFFWKGAVFIISNEVIQGWIVELVERLRSN